MRTLLALLITVSLSGCISSPQGAQYAAEYANHQDIRSQSVYRFNTKAIKPSGESYWGSNDLAQLFYVSSEKAAVVKLRFNYPDKTVQATSLDAQNNVLRQTTFILLDESAEKPSDPEALYFYLTPKGELLRKTRNCTPDMSVGCQWYNHQVFITHSGNLATQYETGAAGMAFLVFPMYGSQKYLEIFPKAPG
jgi:hypothetical protein